VWTSRRNEGSTVWRRAFHAKDNLAASAGGGVASWGDTDTRNGCRVRITGYWSFIRSLLAARIPGLKRVVITGGTGGLGTAIAGKFAGNGWEVVALGSNDLDLADGGAVGRFFDETPCDLLVCCAGMIRDAPLSRMEEVAWDKVMALNYGAAARCALSAIPGMRARGSGHVVFVSSYAARRPAVGQAAYAAAKAALHGLARDLAERYGKDGLRCNVVLPGFLETPMTEAVSERRKAVIREGHCLGGFNTPEAAAGFVWFLEEKLPFTSGQVFSLDSRL
jgi:3-oxoacyl-[acyl-carrier protein] reductase